MTPALAVAAVAAVWAALLGGVLWAGRRLARHRERMRDEGDR